jgi:hypothetical protein
MPQAPVNSPRSSAMMRSGDHLELHAKKLAVNNRKGVRLGADARGAGNDLTGVQVGDRMHAAACGDDAGIVIAVHVADPGKLAKYCN